MLSRALSRFLLATTMLLAVTVPELSLFEMYQAWVGRTLVWGLEGLGKVPLCSWCPREPYVVIELGFIICKMRTVPIYRFAMRIK